MHRRNEVESAPHEVSDDDSHENEPEYSVDVLHDLLEHYFLRSSLPTEYSLDHRIDLREIEKVDDSWDSYKSDELEGHKHHLIGILTFLISLDQIQRKGGSPLIDPSSFHEVPLCDHAMGDFDFWCL